MTLSATQIAAALEATWPPARVFEDGPWRYRVGAGGGKRVCATSAMRDVSVNDIDVAEEQMRAAGQTPLFVLYEADDPLDALLADRGYAKVDPTNAMVAPVAMLTDIPIPPVTVFEIWEPLAIMKEIWAKGGVGPARLDVMSRAKVKTALFARAGDKPAGVAFVALHGDVAMVHAVEVLPAFRRKGVAQWLMRASAFWAQRHKAEMLTVLCVRANLPAQALYSTLGFQECCGYHYRMLTREGPAA